MYDPTNIGATAGELASLPGLLTDLALSLVTRRLGVAQSLLTLLGGYSRDKVRTLLAEVERCRVEMTSRVGDHGNSTRDMYDAGRDLLAATAKLEAAVFSLVSARVRFGAGRPRATA